MDGMSKMLCLLTALSFPVIFLANFRQSFRMPGAFYGWMLLSQAGLMGVFLAIYSYVYIFMARNGIGLAALLFIGWLVIGIPVYVRNVLKKQTVRISRFLLSSTLVLVAAFLFGWLG
jgi:hypothetical protein